MDRNTATPLALLHHYVFASTGFRTAFIYFRTAVSFFSKYLKIPNPTKTKKEATEKTAEGHEFQKNTRLACNKQQDINTVTLTTEYNCHSGLDE